MIEKKEKEMMKLRKKLRKKGALTDYSALNNGTMIYCSVLQSADGGEGAPIGETHAEESTVGKHPGSKYWAVVSSHHRRVKPARPIKTEEVITITPFRRGERPKIKIFGGGTVETVDC